MSIFKLTAPIPSESDEAICLVQWSQIKRYLGHRLSDFLIMIPNGTKLFGDPRERAMQMQHMKRCGLKPGASDYFLAIPVSPYHGLWIELKRTKLGVVSDEQKKFQYRMTSVGYAAVIAHGWDEARGVIEHYLRGSE